MVEVCKVRLYMSEYINIIHAYFVYMQNVYCSLCIYPNLLLLFSSDDGSASLVVQFVQYIFFHHSLPYYDPMLLCAFSTIFPMLK